MSSSKLLKKLEAALDAQAKTIVRLEAKVVALEAEIVTLKTKKNSSNSHTPPSGDPNRPKANQSLRVKTGLAAGGQPGHEGKTLGCRTMADEVIRHSPRYCACCGNDLAAVTETLVASRQVLDVLPVVLQCYEHQTYKKKCSCGHVAEGSFPGYVSAAVQYGPNTEALVGYLHTRQYIPYRRMKEFLNDVMKLPVSTGGIHNILQRLAQKATPVYGATKERIEQAAVVGADETGLNINGKLHWMWAWQNERLTYLVASANRAFKTIEDTFVNGLPKAAVNHERYAAHFKMNARQHQMCTAHLLRDLTYLDELYAEKCSWAKDFKRLLSEAVALKKQLTAAQYYHPAVFEYIDCLPVAVLYVPRTLVYIDFDPNAVLNLRCRCNCTWPNCLQLLGCSCLVAVNNAAIPAAKFEWLEVLCPSTLKPTRKLPSPLLLALREYSLYYYYCRQRCWSITRMPQYLHCRRRCYSCTKLCCQKRCPQSPGLLKVTGSQDPILYAVIDNASFLYFLP